MFTFKLSKVVAAVSLAVGLGLSNQAMAGEIITSNNNCKANYSYPYPNETATWSGECKNGWVHGQGIFQWYRDGKPLHKYVGEYKDGKMHGQGIFTWSDGSKYIGSWYDDKHNGLGKLILVKNSNAIKSWQNDGKGKWVGDIYVIEGYFINNGLDIACNSKSQKSCNDAYAAKAESDKQAAIRACGNRYVGQSLNLVRGLGIFALAEPFIVTGIGKTQMTVKSNVDGAMFNIRCDADRV